MRIAACYRIRRCTPQGYANGYFWGMTAGKFGDNAISCASLVGSVTPEGRVYLTFTPAPFTAGSAPTIGIGQMVKKGGQWTMTNQMSTGAPGLQLGHWAYMLRTRPGDRTWNSLPGVNMCVDAFMADCPAAPLPVK